jgi:hypothetical protein
MPGETPTIKAPLCPLTEHQINTKIDEFIGSVDEKGIVRLASQYNNNERCEIFGRENGSFNVCFFVRFHVDDTKWVVRVPIVPVVEDHWAKVQSEVATVQYGLPFHREDNNELLNSTGTSNSTRLFRCLIYTRTGRATMIISGSTIPFIICDYISGRPIDRDALLSATSKQRSKLLDDLIGIMSQLRTMQFPAAGSLMLSGNGPASPVVGDSLSIAGNELGRCRKGQKLARSFSTTQEFVTRQYHLL